MEKLDVVDEFDKTIDTLDIKTVYEKKLRHRIVHLLIFNKKGDILLQKRSKNKSFFPNAWVSSAGGHVQSEEDYENAAKRECFEELGIKPKDLDFLTKELYKDTEHQIGLEKFMEIYKSQYEGPFEINEKEVQLVEFCSMKKIRRMIEEGEIFHPELLMILKKYFKL